MIELRQQYSSAVVNARKEEKCHSIFSRADSMKPYEAVTPSSAPLLSLLQVR